MRRSLLAKVMMLALAMGCSSEDEPKSGASRPVTVAEPSAVGKGKPLTSSLVDLTPHGYREKEFFFSGEATNYQPQGDLTEDGKWQLAEGAQAPFVSRLLVRRPSDATKFNGTVLVEWLNVSGGVDSDPGFMYNWEEIVREGYAWVGVTAQKSGVDGGGLSLAPTGATPLKQYDPERYATLLHPGDSYSFDIFTRAAELVQGAGKLDVLEGLKPSRVIAYGESQSASRLVSYINGVHPLVEVFDGFFVHSRSNGGSGFGDEFMIPIGGSPMRIRDDTEQPVFQFQTETDVIGLFGYARARQPDSAKLRSWEVAGTAHADAHILSVGGEASSVIMCANINDGPQHFVIKAALHALNVWLEDGTLPPQGTPLELGAKDEHGNTRGGVRTPHVDVPVSTLSGEAADGSDILCSLFGSSEPFSPDKLAQLYPTHESYVSKVTSSAAQARAGGFLLEPEERLMITEASAAKVP